MIRFDWMDCVWLGAGAALPFVLDRAGTGVSAVAVVAWLGLGLWLDRRDRRGKP